MAQSNQVTVEKVIIALASTGEYTAKQILAEVRQVFPMAKTTTKSIYSTVSRANIRMPGSQGAFVNAQALEALYARLYPAPEAKTGTDNN